MNPRTPRLHWLCYAAVLWLSWSPALLAQGTPKIQFNRTVLDFGETFASSGLSGVFKFRNSGEGLLKLDAPMPDCGCTVAELSAATLKPGETGEVAFTLNVGLSREILEKHIIVTSNDPKTPEVTLVIKVDYTPLFEVPPEPLLPVLPLGVSSTNLLTTLTRNDGKPIGSLKLVGSQSWLTARVEGPLKTNAVSAPIQIQIQRQGSPRRFNENILVYRSDDTNSPVATLYVSGQFLGELVTSPETLYFGLPDPARQKEPLPDAMLTRRLTVVSATGKAFLLKNLQSSLTNIVVALEPGEAGRSFEIVARLLHPPALTTVGTVSFESSVPSQGRTEVPVVVTVTKER